MLQRECFLISAEHVIAPLIRDDQVSHGGLVEGEVRGGHQRVRVVLAQCFPALAERLPTKLYRLAQPAVRDEVGSDVDIRHQGVGMPVPVDPDESLPGLLVVQECLSSLFAEAEHGREVYQSCVQKVVLRAGFLAESTGLTSQRLGAG
jgi:hypothetical protein